MKAILPTKYRITAQIRKRLTLMNMSGKRKRNAVFTSVKIIAVLTDIFPSLFWRDLYKRLV